MHIKRPCFGKVQARLGQREKKYGLKLDFKEICIDFYFDLEKWFKVTAHPLPKGTLQVKYEPDWAVGREDMLWTSNLGRIDRWMDRLITTGRLQSEGPNKPICSTDYFVKH